MWNELFHYAIKSAIVLALLYTPYTLLLRKERIFRQNRFTLLAILVFSLVLPFCDGMHSIQAIFWQVSHQSPSLYMKRNLRRSLQEYPLPHLSF